MFRGNEFNLLYVTIAVSSNSIFQLPSAVVSGSEGEEKRKKREEARERERERAIDERRNNVQILFNLWIVIRGRLYGPVKVGHGWKRDS